MTALMINYYLIVPTAFGSCYSLAVIYGLGHTFHAWVKHMRCCSLNVEHQL